MANGIQKTSKEEAKSTLRCFAKLIEEEQQALLDAKDVKKVGYICNYTPVELLSAAGVHHSRLIKAGSAKTVSAGELYTQSVFCDFTKSCIGFFQEGDPYYKAFDKVYNFHSCSTMKRASEVIEQFVPTRLLNLPKLRSSQDARNFFREEILNFKADLGELVGKPIDDAEVHRQITLYNQARSILKKISALRKRPDPALTGAEFLDLVRGYYYLPAEKLVPALNQVLRHLEGLPEGKAKRLRLMVSASWPVATAAFWTSSKASWARASSSKTTVLGSGPSITRSPRSGIRTWPWPTAILIRPRAHG